MFNIIKLCILVAFLIAAGVFVYYLFYTSQINRRIKSGEVTGKKFVDIPKVVMIAVIALLVLYCGILIHSIQNLQKNSETHTRNDYAVINVSDSGSYDYEAYAGNAELDDASFATIYSKEKNAGYAKEIITDGDYVFTVFKRTSASDNFHPDFLCYAEYSGDSKDNLLVYNTASFVASTDNQPYLGTESSGQNVEDCLLYIGNLDDGCDFVINCSLLDDEFTNAMQKTEETDEGETPNAMDYAVSSGQVRISFE